MALEGLLGALGSSWARAGTGGGGKRDVDGGEARSPVLTPAYLPGPPGPRLAPTPAPPLLPAAGCD